MVVDGIEWQVGVTRNMSLWHQWLSVSGHYHHMGDFGVGVRFDYLSLTLDGTRTYAFTNPENIRELNAAVLATVSTEERIHQLEDAYRRLGDQLLAALAACLHQRSHTAWEVFVAEYRRYTAGLFITTVIGRHGGETLRALLKTAGVVDAELDGAINTVTYPSTHTPLFDSQLELLRIGEHVQRGEFTRDAVVSALGEWVERFGHIPVNFCDEPWTLTNAQQQFDDILKKDCVAELQARSESHERKVAAGQGILARIGSLEISVLAHALQAGTILNEYRKNVFSRVSLEYRPLFEYAAQATGLPSWRECFFLFPEEMTRVFEGAQLPAQTLVCERQAVLLRMREGQVAMLDAETTEHVRAVAVGTHAAEAAVSTKELRGMIANTGKVRGIARVVLNSKDFHKFDAGDILVTTMTSVDFVPIMEKAAAFVTNEGGITSHASIVAREMNKPCIIGTKIATQVLKDGDDVEVDAERGVVRILRRGR